jgi:hypothetical protein
VVVAVLVAVTNGPAAAQQRTLRDPRGDAPPSADITRVHLRNAQHRVSAAVKVVNLAHGSDITLTVNRPGPGRYILRTGGNGKGFLDFARGAGETRVHCPGWTLARHTGSRSLMAVSIPQHCFGKRAGTARLNLTMFQAGGAGSDRVRALPITLRRG